VWDWAFDSVIDEGKQATLTLWETRTTKSIQSPDEEACTLKLCDYISKAVRASPRMVRAASIACGKSASA